MFVYGVFADIQQVQGNLHSFAWELNSLHSTLKSAEEEVINLQKGGFPWKLDIRELEVL